MSNTSLLSRQTLMNVFQIRVKMVETAPILFMTTSASVLYLGTANSAMLKVKFLFVLNHSKGKKFIDCNNSPGFSKLLFQLN